MKFNSNCDVIETLYRLGYRSIISVAEGYYSAIKDSKVYWASEINDVLVVYEFKEWVTVQKPNK